MATITAAGGSWTTAGNWVGGVVPTAADDVVIPNGVTQNVNSSIVACRSLTVQNGGTIRWTATATLPIGDASGGALTIGATATVTIDGGVTSTINFVSTSTNGGAGWPITTNGRTLPNVTFNGAGGKWVLQDAVTSTGTWSLTAGHLDTNSLNLTTAALFATGAGVKVLTLGSTTWTTTSNNTGVSIGGSNLTLNAGTSTVKSVAVLNHNLFGSGVTWNNVVFEGAGSPSVQGLTCQNLTRTGTAVATDGLAIHVSSVTVLGTFTVTGNSSTNRVLVYSTVLGTPVVISAAATALTDVDFMDIAIVGPNGSTITSDSFNRADGALGTTDAAAGGTAKTWTESSAGCFVVLSNQVDFTITAAGRHVATIDAGSTAQYVEAKITRDAPGHTMGLIVRSSVGANDGILIATDGAGSISASINGSSQTSLGLPTFVSGQTLGVKITSGSVVQVFIDGVLRGTYLPSFFTSMPTGTHCGLAGRQSVDSRWDDFVAKAVPDVTGTRLGDCLGNSGITFQTSRTLYGVAAGNFSSSAMWSLTSGGTAGEAAPLPQDDVVLDAASAAGTYTNNLPRTCRNFTATGFTRTLACGSAGMSVYGSYTLSAGMTYSPTTGGGLEFRGRGSHTITSAGKLTDGGYSTRIYAPGGTYTAADNWVTGTTIDLYLEHLAGTLDISGRTIDLNRLNSTGTLTRSLVMTNAVVSVGFVTGTWAISGSGCTVTAAGSTIIINTALTVSRTFAGGGFTYGALVYTVADSPGALVITGANTFSSVTIGAGRQLTLPANTITTIGDLTLQGAKRDGFRMETTGSATLPASAAVNLAGDFTIDVKMALDDWTPASDHQSLGVWGGTGQRSWVLQHRSTGVAILTQSQDGSIGSNFQSSTAFTLVDGDPLWIRASFGVTTLRTVRFYQSSDGTTWTQVGSAVTNGGTGTFAGAQPLVVNYSASTPTDYHRVKLYNADLGTGAGTPTVDLDFEGKPFLRDTLQNGSSGDQVVFAGTNVLLGDGRTLVRSSTSGTSATVLVTGAVDQHSGVDVQDVTFNGTDAFLGAQAAIRSNVRGVKRSPRQGIMV